LFDRNHDLQLPYFDNDPFAVEKYVKLSLEKLALEYIDLYLIHAPFGVVHNNGTYDIAINANGTVVLNDNIDHIKIWKV
jgi:alcohol dehydrogenase (NADP+)